MKSIRVRADMILVGDRIPALGRVTGIHLFGEGERPLRLTTEGESEDGTGEEHTSWEVWEKISVEREEKRSRRVDLERILSVPLMRRELLVNALIALQAREGIVTSREDAERAYDVVMGERALL